MIIHLKTFKPDLGHCNVSLLRNEIQIRHCSEQAAATLHSLNKKEGHVVKACFRCVQPLHLPSHKSFVMSSIKTIRRRGAFMVARTDQDKWIGGVKEQELNGRRK